MDIRYRLRQLWRNLTAGPLPEEARGEIRAVLRPEEMALFERFSATDQSHSYRVMRMLMDAGDNDPALLKAALLHDIGKSSVCFSALDRSVVVLGERLLPGRAAQWGAGAPEGWRRPFAVRQQHPDWGAELAAMAGCEPMVVNLIRRHQEPPPTRAESVEDRLLLRLQWADDQN